MRDDAPTKAKLTAPRSGGTPSTLTVGALTPNAMKVLETRYLLKDGQGRTIETPDGMFRRVAWAVAEADRLLPHEGRLDPQRSAEEFHRMLSSLQFLPNSPTLMNAGKDLQQLCACFVLPVEDSMEGIFETLKQTAVIHKTGGGTGFSFSRLRAKNSRVRSTSGIASGPVSFMKVFNAATEAIKQGGTRRGANMGILRVDHPDILEFIDCKRDGTEVTNFNISVAVTDAFMQALAEDREYELIGPDENVPSGFRGAGRLRAGEVLDRMAENAWLCGDPGIIFIDRINRANPTRHIAEIEATNPCGEQPLSPHEACTLGSINLGLMLEPGGAARISYEKLASTVRTAIHFLDNVIEVTRHPVAEIERVTKGNRRVGLGVMGWADLLIALGIPYDSEEAVQLGEEVMTFIQEHSRGASAELAAERGAFPNFAGSPLDRAGSAPTRNATTTTVAPTGTISIIAGASSGIEPLFAVAYARRNILDLGEQKEMCEVHPHFLKMAGEAGILDEDLLTRVAASGGVRRMPDGEIPEEIRRLFATAHDLSPDWHVRMQAAFQRHCDNAVSKTVNLPESATPADVRDVYLRAYEMGCKGVTVYRDRSRKAQVLNIADAARPLRPSQSSAVHLDAIGKTLHRHMRDSSLRSRNATEPFPTRYPCPECGEEVWAGSGCASCHFCGYSRCE